MVNRSLTEHQRGKCGNFCLFGKLTLWVVFEKQQKQFQLSGMIRNWMSGAEEWVGGKEIWWTTRDQGSFSLGWGEFLGWGNRAVERDYCFLKSGRQIIGYSSKVKQNNDQKTDREAGKGFFFFWQKRNKKKWLDIPKKVRPNGEKLWKVFSDNLFLRDAFLTGLL